MGGCKGKGSLRGYRPLMLAHDSFACVYVGTSLCVCVCVLYRVSGGPSIYQREGPSGQGAKKGRGILDFITI